MIVGPTGAGKTRAIERLRAAGVLPRAPAPPTAWPDDRAVISAIAASPLVAAAAAAQAAAAKTPGGKQATLGEVGVDGGRDEGQQSVAQGVSVKGRNIARRGKGDAEGGAAAWWRGRCWRWWCPMMR